MTEPQSVTSTVPQQPSPLLSICIPTCNRAGFLRVMLEALLPQVRECGDAVEVCVLDNASTDATGEVLEQSRSLGPIRVYRQPTNLGPARNLIDGPARHAQGKYSWVLGDHNLLRPGALRKVVRILEQNQGLSVFYTRFRCALHPEHWPTGATGGYDGNFEYLSDGENADRILAHWHQILNPATSIGTQAYAHIVRTDIWQRYWAERKLGSDFSDAWTTYPHTTMLCDTVLTEPVYVISDPPITIFNGAQSWSGFSLRQKVFLRGLPDLLRILKKQNALPKAQVRLITNCFVKPNCRQVIAASLERDGVLSLLKNHGFTIVSNYYLIPDSLLLSFKTTCPQLYASCKRKVDSICNPGRWWILNCRPVRWLRALLPRTWLV